MDPNAALQKVIEERKALDDPAVTQDPVATFDHSEAFIEAVDNLLDWLATGGFAPNWGPWLDVYK